MDNKDKRFATLRFEKNPMREILLKALDMVRHFMIRNELILVGGMSIDANMRLKGLKLYDDDEIPDYDMYSPKNVEHAYTLGSLLCEAKFPSVDVIAAIHTTTMKVRVDGNVVADITYMPPEIFSKMRTQEYKGIKIIHPWYTMMDQFRSLSIPYENPPNEVILNRGRKDVDRLNLLLSAYPLGDPDVKIDLPEKMHKCKPVHHINGVYNGWAALAYYYDYYKLESELKYNKDDHTFTLPVTYVTMMTTNIPDLENMQYYNALGGYPKHVKLVNKPKDDVIMEIFDTWGERITAFGNFVSVTNLMYYFLHVWLMRGDDLGLLGVRMTQPLLALQPLDVTPYGTSSWNTSTLYSIANILDWNRVKNWKPSTQDFSETCDIKKSFDVSKSPLFAIGESKTDRFEPIVDPKFLEIKPSKAKVRSFRIRSIH